MATELKEGDLVECRDMPVKLLSEMADVLDQACHSLAQAQDIAQSAMSAFACQREVVAEQRNHLLQLMQ